MRPVGALLCTAMALLVPVPAVPEEQALAIVVHRARTDALDIEDLARIYLRKRRFWDDGAPIVALHRQLGTSAPAFFSRRIPPADPGQLRASSDQQYFRGVLPPLVM